MFELFLKLGVGSTPYLLEVSPQLDIGDILQGFYGHEVGLVHARQIQVSLVDLP